MNLARATRWVSAPLALGVGLLAIAIPSAMAQTDWGVRKVYYEGENRGRGEGNYHNSVNNNPVIRATYRDLVDDNKAVYVEGEFWHYEYACSPSTCYWDWFKKDEQQTTHSQFFSDTTESLWYDAGSQADLSLYRGRAKVCLDIPWHADDCSNSSGDTWTSWLY
jgi:hypothetical protein